MSCMQRAPFRVLLLLRALNRFKHNQSPKKVGPILYAPEPRSILPSLNTAVLSCQIFFRVLVYKDYQLLKICKALEYKLLARPSTTIPTPTDNYGGFLAAGGWHEIGTCTCFPQPQGPGHGHVDAHQIRSRLRVIFIIAGPALPYSRNTSTTSAQATVSRFCRPHLQCCSALHCPALPTAPHSPEQPRPACPGVSPHRMGCSLSGV